MLHGVHVGEVIERLGAIHGRGAGTDAERRAAVWLAGLLDADGHAASIETHWVRPAWAVAVAFGAFLGVVGSLLSVAIAPAGVVLASIAALCLALEAAGRTSPLRFATGARATQNVVVPPDGEAIELLVCAAYDAPRRGLVLNDRWRGMGTRLRNVRAWLALCALVIAGAAAFRAADVEGILLGAIQLVPTVVLIAALAAALDIALSEFTPGAASASAAAVALAVHEELRRDPPAALTPALLLYGAGASGPHGLRAHLRGTRRDRTRVVVLEIGPCTAGTPGFASRHPQLRLAAERAASALGVPPAPRRPRRTRGTGTLPALRLACLDGRGLAVRLHQPDDVAELADPEAATAALDLALGIADALDADLRIRSEEEQPAVS